MTTIDKSLEYIDDQVLDVDKHNENVYSWESGKGLMSTANGDIDLDNFDSGLEVYNSHIHPGEVARTSQDFGTETLDYIADGISSQAADAKYIPIGGIATRIYVPYGCSMALWQWSTFMSVWRWRDYKVLMNDPDQYSGTDTPPSEVFSNVNGATIRVIASVDGNAVEHSKRDLPMTEQIIRIKYGEWLDGPNPDGEMLFGCLPLDGCHLQQNLSNGWHTLELRVWMEADVSTQYLYESIALRKSFLGTIIKTFKETSVTSLVSQRVSFGFRNARCLTLL